MSKQKRICAVCGDRAIGRNFGAITCESCKAFFRRTAFKIQSLNCIHNENKCLINIENRKNCKKCRIIKCFDIGMKKELVMRKDEKEFSDESDRNQVNSPSSDSNSMSSIDLILSDQDFDSVFENCCISDEDICAEIMEIDRFLTNSDSENDEILNQKALEVCVTPIVRPIACYNKQFNDIELNRIKELSSATNCFENLFVCHNLIPFSSKIIEYKSLREIYQDLSAINKFEDSVRQFVKFCKSLSSFQDICEEDQLALVKNNCIEVTTLIHIIYYNFDEDYWIIYLNDKNALRVRLDLLKSERMNAYSVAKRFLQNISSEWRLDPVVMYLLSAVMLFHPNRPNVTHKELVKLKQQMYLYLLQKYLLQKYRSEYKTTENCSKMLNTLTDLQVMTKADKEVAKDYIEYVTPLLREIIE